jgi:hypothetical protein
MNAEGTQVQSFEWTEVGGSVHTTTMAFPTAFTAYPAGYSWDGQLSTTDLNGALVCATASKSSFVSYNMYKTNNQIPLPLSLLGDNGLSWTTIHEVLALPPNPNPNPTDAAILSCSTGGADAPANAAFAPVNAAQTASFLTVTSTSHEDNRPASTTKQESNSKKPEATTTPESQVLQLSTVADAILQKGTTSVNVGGAIESLLLPSSSTGIQTVVSGTTYQVVPQSSTTPSSAPRVHSESSGLTLSTSHLVIGSTTSTPLATAPPNVLSTNPVAVVVSGTAYYPIVISSGRSSVYHIGSQTLAVGSTITVGSGSSAQTIALQTSNGNTELVVGGSTSILSTGESSSTVAAGVGVNTTSGVVATLSTTNQDLSGTINSGLGGTASAPIVTTSSSPGRQSWGLDSGMAFIVAFCFTALSV